jgi:ketol-acid reductoisomerase
VGGVVVNMLIQKDQVTAASPEFVRNRPAQDESARLDPGDVLYFSHGFSIGERDIDYAGGIATSLTTKATPATPIPTAGG